MYGPDVPPPAIAYNILASGSFSFSPASVIFACGLLFALALVGTWLDVTGRRWAGRASLLLANTALALLLALAAPFSPVFSLIMWGLVALGLIACALALLRPQPPRPVASLA